MKEKPELIGEQVSRKQWGKVILERQFRLPSGEVIDYFNWGGTVIPSIVFPITENHEVVALKQFRYGINDFVTELPGGCPDQSESFDEISRKELIEETGFRAENFTKLGPSLWFEPANCITPYVPVLATGCVKVGEPKPEETEFIEVFIYSIEEWIAKIYSGEVRDSKSITVTFLALPYLGYRLK